MITRPDDQAFPAAENTTPEGFRIAPNPGLTKREEFAKVALQGLLAGPDPDEPPKSEKEFADLVARLTESAVAYADALIAALNKQSEPQPQTDRRYTSNDHQ